MPIRVEFVGLPSPFADPQVRRALAAPVQSHQQRREIALIRKELTKQEKRRQMWGFARVNGRTSTRLDERHGLSRAYVWGPRIWTVEMEPADVDVLMRAPWIQKESQREAHRRAFVVHDDAPIIIAS